MDFVDKVLFHVALIPWEQVAIYLGSAGLIIPITTYVKNKLNNKTKQKVLAIVTSLSLLPQIIDQLVQNQAAWVQYLPSQFGWLFTAVILLHGFFASPVWRRLSASLSQYRQALDMVRAEGNNQAAPISNPNLTLNAPSTAKPAQTPLNIQ